MWRKEFSQLKDLTLSLKKMGKLFPGRKKICRSMIIKVQLQKRGPLLNGPKKDSSKNIRAMMFKFWTLKETKL